MRFKSMIFYAGALFVSSGFFCSCSKTKQIEGEYSCTEINTNAPDSAYFKSYTVSEVDRKTIQIGIYNMDHIDGTKYQYSVGDATYQVSVTATFYGDSAYIKHFSHHYYDNPMNITRNASCLKQ